VFAWAATSTIQNCQSGGAAGHVGGGSFSSCGGVVGQPGGGFHLRVRCCSNAKAFPSGCHQAFDWRTANAVTTSRHGSSCRRFLVAHSVFHLALTNSGILHRAIRFDDYELTIVCFTQTTLIIFFDQLGSQRLGVLCTSDSFLSGCTFLHIVELDGKNF